jgi:diguanylate cyclase (GGDEF)-like protein
MALIDPLTSLPNRRSFWERLMAAEAIALATNRKYGLIYLDLDDFKLINDLLGHDAGDDLLRRISVAMAGIVRSGDCLSRIGGDEFVVLMEDIHNRGEIEALAARLTAKVASEAISADYGTSVRVSCGIALFPEPGLSAHDAIREADAAMYREKRRRRMAEETVCVAAPYCESPAADPRRTRAVAPAGMAARRRSDGSRLAGLPARRGVSRASIAPRFSWNDPLSWIGY